MEKLDKLINILQKSEMIDGLDSSQVAVNITSDDWYFDVDSNTHETTENTSENPSVIRSQMTSVVTVLPRVLIDVLALGCSIIAIMHYNDDDIITRLHSRFMLAVGFTRLLEFIFLPDSRWFVAPSANPRVAESYGLGLPTVLAILVMLLTSNGAITLAVIAFWLITDGQRIVRFTLSDVFRKIWG